MIALTGTATPVTIEFIKSSFLLNNPDLVRLSCLRDNLTFNCEERKGSKSKEVLVLDIINNHPDECGIVYYNTRDESCQMAFELKQKGIRATYYHAGLDEGEKLVNARLWLDGKANVICCTYAFGMGIDKKNLRFVYRLNMPASIKQLVQEGGRGGRDGEAASCKIYYSFNDRTFHLRNISSIENLVVQQQHVMLLNKVTEFCHEKSTCRQQLLGNYFDENATLACNECDNCQKIVSATEQQDMTETAKEIIQCLKELNNVKQYVKLSELVMTYIGSKAKDVSDQKFDKCHYYGKGKGKFRSSQRLTSFVQY